MSLIQRVGDDAIVDSTLAVFATGEFDRTARQAFFDMIGGWIRQFFRMLGAMRSESPALYWTVVVLIAIGVVLMLARGAWLFYTRALERAELRAAGGALTGEARRRDPWQEAQLAAARGDFTSAAHALYTALLQALSRREQVRLHPSKTIGDYVRELRGGSSAALGPFRDFARVYEVVVYGLGVCDRERYERLRALAEPLMEPAGP